MVKGLDRNVLGQYFSNELGQFVQGTRTGKVTNTVIFIPKIQVLKDKKVTCGKIVGKLKPDIEERK